MTYKGDSGDRTRVSQVTVTISDLQGWQWWQNPGFTGDGHHQWLTRVTVGTEPGFHRWRSPSPSHDWSFNASMNWLQRSHIGLHCTGQTHRRHKNNSHDDTHFMAIFHDNLDKLVPECLHSGFLLELRMMVTTGAVTCAKLQSNHHHQHTNTQHFYTPDALPVAEPTESEHGERVHEQLRAWTNTTKDKPVREICRGFCFCAICRK